MNLPLVCPLVLPRGSGDEPPILPPSQLPSGARTPPPPAHLLRGVRGFLQGDNCWSSFPPLKSITQCLTCHIAKTFILLVSGMTSSESIITKWSHCSVLKWFIRAAFLKYCFCILFKATGKNVIAFQISCLSALGIIPILVLWMTKHKKSRL